MKYNAKYQAAADEFKAFNKTRMRGSQAAYYKRLAKNDLKGCDLALALLEQPEEVEITHLNRNINNPIQTFLPDIIPTTISWCMLHWCLKEVIDMGANKRLELQQPHL